MGYNRTFMELKWKTLLAFLRLARLLSHLYGIRDSNNTKSNDKRFLDS